MNPAAKAVLNRIQAYGFDPLLDAEQRDRITTLFQSATGRLGPEDYLYIHAKIRDKFEAVQGHLPAEWSPLLEGVRILYNTLLLHENRLLELSPAGYALIGAALFYFLDPFDFFPDDDPERGYLDDFYVLQLCLNSLSPADLAQVAHTIQQ